MRETMFRGKKLNSGQWIYGNLIKNDGRPIIVEDREGAIDIQHESWFIDVPAARVDPKTVGQYTGRTGEAGKKIYEGDIEETYGVVYFDPEYLGYFAIDKTSGSDACPIYDIPLPRIIGNIHDNPELLSLTKE